jgi:hypothetical protein
MSITTKQFSLFLKEVGVWRADVVDHDVSGSITISVPHQENVRRIERGIKGIIPACVSYQCKVDPTILRKMKKHTYRYFTKNTRHIVSFNTGENKVFYS